MDGKTANLGKTETKGDTTTAILDQAKLDKSLETAKTGSTVTVPVTATKNSAAVQLTAQSVAKMAEKGMVLEVKSGKTGYALPANAIDTGDILAQLGAADASKVPFTVTITGEKNVKVEGMVVPAMSFSISASYNGETVTVDRFDIMVPRTVELTREQADMVTTAVVVEQGGTLRHVPTYVFQKDGKYYATVNSMTNSVYTLVQNEVTFADAAGKWYADVADVVGSRKIVVGTGKGTFDGDTKITRAEYATMMVRALGLPQSKSSSFADVAADAWYAGYVATAGEYGIVKGIGNNRFNPEGLITRQEAMQMIYNASKLTGFPKLLNARNLAAEFGDFATVEKWASEAVSWCLDNNLSVNLNGEVKPAEEITRGEMSAMILLLLQRAELVDVR